MKKLVSALLVILIALTTLLFLKDIIIKSLVKKTVKVVTGLELSIDSFNIGIMQSAVNINRLRLYNPRGFKDRVMLEMPEIRINYDLPAIIRGDVHLKRLNIYLKEFIVVKNEKGELNINSLKMVKALKEGKKSKEESAPKIQIDDLHLKIGKAVYKDYSKGESPSVKEFHIDLDERYANITNLYALASLIVVRTLADTPISKLANFDLDTLKAAMSTAVAVAQDTIRRTAHETKEVAKAVEETLKKTTENLKGLFTTPFDSRKDGE